MIWARTKAEPDIGEAGPIHFVATEIKSGSMLNPG